MNKANIYTIIFVVIFPITLMILSYFVSIVFFYIFSIYGIIALAKLFFQMLYGHINHKIRFKDNPDYLPKISVVIPTYKEDYIVLYNCVKSVALQSYLNYDAWLVDDGTPNGYSKEIAERINKEFPLLNLNYVKFEKNKGKRFAQKYAFDNSNAEILVTIDSDTIIEKNGLYKISRPFIKKYVGAVTGNVRVLNRRRNLLTRLIDLRYWMAFNQERASHSLFGVVMCCSGPFSAYRKSLIDNIKEKYVNQYFLGKLCTFGDDRHLTNLILEQGYKIYYLDNVYAWTNVPYKMSSWLKQQLRWNKSFYREMFWNFKSVFKHQIYMTFELLTNAILPLFLLLNIGIFFYKGIYISSIYFFIYLLMMITIAELRGFYAVYRTGNPMFLLFPLYAILHIFLLIPIRVIAIATLGGNGWGTR